MLILPRNTALLQGNLESLKVRNIEPFVVLFIACPYHDLLLCMVNFQTVHFFRPFKVPDAPLEPLSSVLPDEDRLYAFMWISWLFTFSPEGARRSASGLNDFGGSPISNSHCASPNSLYFFHLRTIFTLLRVIFTKHFVCIHVKFLHELCLIWV